MARETDDMIVLEMSGADDDVKDFQRGEGKIFKRVSKIIAMLEEEGEWASEDSPVICLIRNKT